MTRRRLHLLALALLAVMLAPACAGAGELRADQLSIVAPADLALVRLPATLRWKAHDVPGSVSQYAVFVDHAPMAPGRDVRSLVDDECRHRRGCPDAAYLRTLGIYLTSRPSVVVAVLMQRRGVESHAAHPVHRAVVVGLDRHNRRVGEFSAVATFRSDQ